MAFARMWTMALVLTGAFLLGAVKQASSDEYKETWIVSWCKSPGIFNRIYELQKAGKNQEVLNEWALAVNAQNCVDLTRFGVRMAFKMSGVVAELTFPDGEVFMVIEGNLMGKDDQKKDKVYVLIGKESLNNFRVSAIPKPTGPEYSGWQNV